MGRYHGAETQAIWIKDPIGILAEGAGRGVVVRDGRIVELVPAGSTPTTTMRPSSTPRSMWCCRG